MSSRKGSRSRLYTDICSTSVMDPLENFHVKQWEGIVEIETLSKVDPEMGTADFCDGSTSWSSRTHERV